MELLIIIIIIIGVLFIMTTIIEILTRKRKYEQKIAQMQTNLKVLSEEIENNEKVVDTIISKCDKIIADAKEIAAQYDRSIERAIKMMDIIQEDYNGIVRKIEIIANTFENNGEADAKEIKEYLATIDKDIQLNKKAIALLERKNEKTEGYFYE